MSFAKEMLQQGPIATTAARQGLLTTRAARMIRRALFFFYVLVLVLVGTVAVAVQASQSGSNNQNGRPFKLGIRDSFMIAHSFKHPDFGPAQKMHGATYTCDVEFHRSELANPQNWVIDIGKASDLLSQVLSKYNFQNLDEMFPDGVLTTTEFMSKQIFTDLCQRIKEDGVDFQGSICVKLWESHKAWASFEGELEN